MNISKEELHEIIKEYIKDNLKVQVKIERHYGGYGESSEEITVSLFVSGEGDSPEIFTSGACTLPGLT